jgi:hypothetical protein
VIVHVLHFSVDRNIAVLRETTLPGDDLCSRSIPTSPLGVGDAVRSSYFRCATCKLTA